MSPRRVTDHLPEGATQLPVSQSQVTDSSQITGVEALRLSQAQGASPPKGTLAQKKTRSLALGL